MNQALVQQIWRRARNCFEYCHIPHPQYRLPFQIDHIISRQHGGAATLDNLALACLHCNRHEGPNIAGWDAASNRTVPLFYPRTDVWEEHFGFEEARISGNTPTGRATVQALAMNAEDLLSLRAELLREGVKFT